MKKIISVILLITMIAGCSSNHSENKKVTIVLDWTPNTNHIGLFVAQELGYFEELGYEVEIIQPNQTSALQLVASNRAQIGISYQEELTFALTSENPLPVTAIATILQHNTSGFASVKSSEILSVNDFENKTYGMFGSPTEELILREIMSMNAADFSTVNMTLVNSDDFFTIVPQRVDFAWIFEGWTGIEAEMRGIELNYIPLREIDEKFDFYTPIIVANNKFLEDEETVKDIMSAISRGYQFTVNNPLEASKIFLEQVPEYELDFILKSTEFLNQYFLDEKGQFGFMKDSVWELYSNWLYESGLIEIPLNLEKAFTNEFLLP